MSTFVSKCGCITQRFKNRQWMTFPTAFLSVETSQICVCWFIFGVLFLLHHKNGDWVCAFFPCVSFFCAISVCFSGGVSRAFVVRASPRDGHGVCVAHFMWGCVGGVLFFCHIDFCCWFCVFCPKFPRKKREKSTETPFFGLILGVKNDRRADCPCGVCVVFCVSEIAWICVLLMSKLAKNRPCVMHVFLYTRSVFGILYLY